MSDAESNGRRDDTRRSLFSSLQIVLRAVLTIAVLGALLGVVYISLTPQQATDPYTEFYILGPDGDATGYPTNLTVGERATVVVGVTNREKRHMEYTIVVRANNRTVRTRSINISQDSTWEQPVSYTLEQPGRTRVRFLLYRGSDRPTDSPSYRNLRLWSNVSSER